MGNLVVRAALPYLSFFKENFLYLVSLSGPHLGYLQHSSTLIKTSLWVINKISNCPSMKEVCFEDNRDIQVAFGNNHRKHSSLNSRKPRVFSGLRVSFL